MKKARLRHIRYLAIFFPAVFFLAGPPEFGRDTEFFRGFAIPRPAIRIGLGVGLTDITVRSSSGMKVYQVDKDYQLIGQDLAEAQVKGHREKLSERFAVQVSHTRTKQEAEAAARKLQAKVEYKVTAAENSGGGPLGAWQVKVGDFLTRGDALHCISKLNKLGLKDVWIIREEVAEKDSKAFGLILDGSLTDLDGNTVLFFIPSNPQSFLSYDGKPYRGILSVRHTPEGIVLINTLNIDDYLQGVVPCELSPYEFGEIEAQKAQAIAARTYALKNLGKHGDLGFDLDDSPASQVYRGLGAETPMSTQAVQETKGQVALYKKELIDALYTSTCGGMTEDVENVFPGQATPYLKSVECTTEKEEEWTLKSDKALLPVLWNGRDISEKIAALMALRIIPEQFGSAFFRAPADLADAQSWTRSLLTALGRKTDAWDQDNKPLSHSGLAVFLVNVLSWQERVKNLLLQSEADHVLKDFPELKGEERNDLAYMIVSGVFPPLERADGVEPPVSRAELAFILSKVYALNKPIFEQAILRRAEKGRLEITQSGETKTLALAQDVFLFRTIDNYPSFARRIVLEGGESVSFILDDGQVRLLEVNFDAPTNVLDRPSPFHRWQVRMSRQDLESRINQFYPIGRLVDLIPKERGKSKRVTELQIVGTESQEIVNGLKIRWVLGLRETDFVVDKEADEDGTVTHFTFSGRGWGHGVGLCQVGAFRMAQIGSSYKEILKKYYQGITIDKAY
jgi:stage II sporulation protein D